jgi:hypothetical protein
MGIQTGRGIEKTVKIAASWLRHCAHATRRDVEREKVARLRPLGADA